MPQVTLTFDTDKATLADVYLMLASATREAKGAAIEHAATATETVDTAKANRQAAAANARAAKSGKEQKSRVGPVTTVLGPEEAGEPAQGNGQDQDDDMGLVPPAMSPGEARDAALALVRQVYAANFVAEVKALQKQWGVAKFYDIDVTKGHQFYQDVMKMAQAVGIQA